MRALTRSERGSRRAPGCQRPLVSGLVARTVVMHERRVVVGGSLFEGSLDRRARRGSTRDQEPGKALHLLTDRPRLLYGAPGIGTDRRNDEPHRRN